MGEKKLEEMQPIETKHVFTSKEAMLFIGYKKSKFWELVADRSIIGRKDGTWRFDRAELERYKKRMTVK